MSIIFFVLLCCSIGLIITFNNLAELPPVKTASTANSSENIPGKAVQTINEIPLPEDYKRVLVAEGSFAEWLRDIKLRKDNTVYLYNGNPKPDQSLHYAVLDFSTGNKDLQQCADAVMRLRAEYYFSRKEYYKINFRAANKSYNFQEFLSNTNVSEKNLYGIFLNFMETVFINCGTYTVDAMTHTITLKEMLPGDVFVKAGAPGHAMIIVDVAKNETTGKKIYLLAQSFMPAQDMHIVVNLNDNELSPWYEVNDEEKIITPGWVFEPKQLKRWKN